MEIEFSTKKLAKELTEPSTMVKSYGKDRAKRLNQRLEELRSVSKLEDLRHFPQANCHELTGNLKGYLAMDISKNWRLLFKPSDDPPPLKPDGGLDWSQIEKVCIEAIEDYH